MEYGKYIIIENQGHEQAIMFDSLISHSDFLRLFQKYMIVSAGMFAVGAKPSKDDKNDIDIVIWDKSVTLNIKSRKGKDEILIKKVLRIKY